MTADNPLFTPAAKNSAADQACFHCGLPVPPGAQYSAHVLGAERAMCCPGCKAVAEAIVEGGMEDFYRYRTEASPQGHELVPRELESLRLYDRDALQKSFVTRDGDKREAALILEGMTCPACVWLNEKHVRALAGVLSFSINYSTQRARVQWDSSQIQLSDILQAITALGYAAHPFDAGRQEAQAKRERTIALRRVGVAGLSMMQVMMLAIALYSGDFHGMDENLRDYLRWASLLLTLPVMFYSASGFFISAWRDLKIRRLGMDLPISLTLGLSFIASVWATVMQTGEVYFDTVTMFVFLLLTGRYLEMVARHKASAAADALVKLLPTIAARINDAGEEEMVPVIELSSGDRVRIRPGESVPADGVVIEGRSSVDESLLTGESLPSSRSVGDKLIGGSVNVESPLLMRVEKVGAETMLSSILRLLDRAQAEKPRIGEIADQAAQWFVLGLLITSLLVAAWWWWHEPERAFWVVISLLAITCPCALGLATPAALTAATGSLTRLGLLVTRGHALETLAKVNHVVFDKTGTLTYGRLSLESVIPLPGCALDAEQILQRAASLERASEHPVAKAIVAQAAVSQTPQTPKAESVTALPGQGMEGMIDGRRYRVGNAAFAAGLCGAAPNPPDASGTLVLLADEQQALGWLVLRDVARSEASEVIAELHARGIKVSLLSGDRPLEAQRMGASLGIGQGIDLDMGHGRGPSAGEVFGGLHPQDKLDRLRSFQQDGDVVLMVGDGVNDAPVLAGAQVSLAMGGGTQLAQSSADMILLSENLRHIPKGLSVARKTMRIIHENLAWALGYNLIAIPAAAAGFVPPWLAAVGMSLSSLVVVLNALRLRHA
ncbi:MAG: heavy metal translocating P-type ATPase [Pseudomonadota bacterium]